MMNCSPALRIVLSRVDAALGPIYRELSFGNCIDTIYNYVTTDTLHSIDFRK